MQAKWKVNDLHVLNIILVHLPFLLFKKRRPEKLCKKGHTVFIAKFSQNPYVCPSQNYKGSVCHSTIKNLLYSSFHLAFPICSSTFFIPLYMKKVWSWRVFSEMKRISDQHHAYFHHANRFSFLFHHWI